jgi:hypothetical protein
MGFLWIILLAALALGGVGGGGTSGILSTILSLFQPVTGA